MTGTGPLWSEVEVARRLPWLLVFRGAIGTALLVLTVILDIVDWRMQRASLTLYAVASAVFLIVVVLGVLLRYGIHPLVLGSAHLAAALFTAFVVVDATGGVDSGLTFLYLLAILDGAIIGGQRVAVAVATLCAAAYSGQLFGQMYGYWGQLPAPPRDHATYANAVATHVVAFYLIAFLAGYLGELLRRARAETGAALSDRDSAERLHESVLESLPLGVVTVDSSYRIRTANAAMATILGQPRETILDEPVPSVLLPALVGNTLAADVQYELDGNEKSLSVSYARAEAFHEPLSVLVVEDRTKVRALERDLQMKERLASLGQMAAGIAHEIRNPLAAISGAVELMRDSDDATSRSSLEDIVVREIERLDAMIDDFLSYARPVRPDHQRVDLAALARDVCALISQDPRWATRKLKVHAGTSAFADVDPGQIRQVLWNLLRNAVEASPDHGNVELSVEVDDGHVVLSVIDEGQGIAPDVKKHLYEPFRTTKADGTGLGLAMVHRIVEAHAGTIEIDNRQPRGAIARVVLPHR